MPALSIPRLTILIVLALALSACRTAREPLRPEPIGNLPPVPEETGALNISIVHPPPNQVRPNVDSTFIFGSVGTGDAELTINDEAVPVASNGGFLAFVRVPRDGTFRLEARANGQVDTETYTYRVPERRPPEVSPITPPRVGIVQSEGRDTVDTGSQTAYATSTPNGDRILFMLPETRVTVTGRVGDQLRINLAPGREAWMPASAVELLDTTAGSNASLSSLEILASDGVVDVRVGAGHVPFLVASEDRQATITIYNVDASSAPSLRVQDPWISAASITGASGDSLQLRLDLTRPFWGYKAFHDAGGTLVIRLRRPPQLGTDGSLAGLRILVDPGHPPAGATGPTRLTEAEANLRIALELRDLLQQRGAEVLMTRDDATPMISATNAADELWRRVEYAVDEDADLLVSVHNNAFPDGVNPFRNHGSEVYYFHDFSRGLAHHLVDEIAAEAGIPNNGALQRSLALARPSWMPAVLTESLYMMFPQQEAALRDPGFIRRLAEAHARGIERFVEERLR